MSPLITGHDVQIGLSYAFVCAVIVALAFFLAGGHRR